MYGAGAAGLSGVDWLLPTPSTRVKKSVMIMMIVAFFALCHHPIFPFLMILIPMAWATRRHRDGVEGAGKVGVFSRDPKIAQVLGTGKTILKNVVVLTVVSIFAIV